MRRSCLSLGITYINTWPRTVVRCTATNSWSYEVYKMWRAHSELHYFSCNSNFLFLLLCRLEFLWRHCYMCFSEVDNCTTPSAKLKRCLLPNKVTLTEMAGNKTGSGSGNTYCNNYLVVIEHSSALFHLLLRRWIGWWYSYRRSWTVWNIPRILLSNKNWTRPSSVFKTQTNSNRSADLSTRVHLPRPTLITFFLQIHSFTAT